MTSVNVDHFVETERPFTAESRHAVPTDIHLEDGRLMWRVCFSASKLRWREVRPEVEMLNQFLRLADATDEQILKYARRWGVLNLCPGHLFPSCHNPFCEQLESTPDPKGEPVSEWREFARKMQAILTISDKLVVGNLAGAKEWKVFIKDEWIRDSPLLRELEKQEKKYQEALKFQRRKLAEIIDFCIQISALRPMISWGGEAISLNFIGHPKSKLFGALVTQLLLMSGRSGVACCSECRVWYEREKRRPKRGQANYCPDCESKGVPLRNAKRAQRKRESAR